ncbi:unnamed protein product [Pedinophyceae sp. YPF-701]|nr:unnamed protein product [Pedinophyceae sp. YPF-701]
MRLLALIAVLLAVVSPIRAAHPRSMKGLGLISSFFSGAHQGSAQVLCFPGSASCKSSSVRAATTCSSSMYASGSCGTSASSGSLNMAVAVARPVVATAATTTASEVKCVTCEASQPTVPHVSWKQLTTTKSVPVTTTEEQKSWFCDGVWSTTACVDHEVEETTYTPPSPVPYVSVVSWESSGVNVCWDKPLDDGGCKMSYVVKVQQGDQVATVSPEAQFDQCLVISQLDPCVTNLISVKAVNCVAEAEAASITVAAGSYAECGAAYEVVKRTVTEVPAQTKIAQVQKTTVKQVTETSLVPVVEHTTAALCSSCQQGVLSSVVPAQVLVSTYGSLEAYKKQYLESLQQTNTCTATQRLDALCTDTCALARDGICQEGAGCAAGTDCSDCQAVPAGDDALQLARLAVQNALLSCQRSSYSLANSMQRALFYDAAGFTCGAAAATCADGGVNGSVQFEDLDDDVAQAVAVLQDIRAQLNAQHKVQVSLADLIVVGAAEGCAWLGGPQTIVRLGRADAVAADAGVRQVVVNKQFHHDSKTLSSVLHGSMGLELGHAAALTAGNAFGALQGASQVVDFSGVKTFVAAAANGEAESLCGSSCGQVATTLTGSADFSSFVNTWAYNAQSFTSAYAGALQSLGTLGCVWK